MVLSDLPQGSAGTANGLDAQMLSPSLTWRQRKKLEIAGELPSARPQSSDVIFNGEFDTQIADIFHTTRDEDTQRGPADFSNQLAPIASSAPIHTHQPRIPPVERNRGDLSARIKDVARVDSAENTLTQEVTYLLTEVPVANTRLIGDLKRLIRSIGEAEDYTQIVGDKAYVFLIFANERPAYRALDFIQTAKESDFPVGFFAHVAQVPLLDVRERIPADVRKVLASGYNRLIKGTGSSYMSEEGTIAASHSRVSTLIQPSFTYENGVYKIENITRGLRDPEAMDFAANRMHGRDAEFSAECHKLLAFAKGGPVKPSLIAGTAGAGKTELKNRIVVWMNDPDTLQKHPELINLILLNTTAIDDKATKSFSYLVSEFLPKLLDKSQPEGANVCPEAYMYLESIRQQGLSSAQGTDFFVDDKKVLAALKTYIAAISQPSCGLKVVLFADDAHWRDMTSASMVLDPLFRSFKDQMHTVHLTRVGGKERMQGTTLSALHLSLQDAVSIGPIPCYTDAEKKTLSPVYIAMVNDIIGKRLGGKAIPEDFIINEKFLRSLAEASNGVAVAIAYGLIRFVDKGHITRSEDGSVAVDSNAIDLHLDPVLENIFSNQAQDLLGEFPESTEIFATLLALSESKSCSFDNFAQLFASNKAAYGVFQNLIDRSTISVADGYVSFVLPLIPEKLRALLSSTGHIANAHARIAQFFDQQQVSPHLIYAHAQKAGDTNVMKKNAVGALNEHMNRLEYADALAIYTSTIEGGDETVDMDMHLKALRAMASTGKNFTDMRQFGSMLYDQFSALLPADQLHAQFQGVQHGTVVNQPAYKQWTDENVNELIALLDTMADGYFMLCNQSSGADLEVVTAEMKVWTERFGHVSQVLRGLADQGSTQSPVFFGILDVLQKYHRARTFFREKSYREAGAEFTGVTVLARSFDTLPNGNGERINGDKRILQKLAQASRYRFQASLHSRNQFGFYREYSADATARQRRSSKGGHGPTAITMKDEGLLEMLSNLSPLDRILNGCLVHAKDFFARIEQDPSIAPSHADVARTLEAEGRVFDQVGQFDSAYLSITEARSIATKLGNYTTQSLSSMTLAAMLGRMARKLLVEGDTDPNFLCEIEKVTTRLRREETVDKDAVHIAPDQRGVFLVDAANKAIGEAHAGFGEMNAPHYQVYSSMNAVDFANLYRVAHGGNYSLDDADYLTSVLQNLGETLPHYGDDSDTQFFGAPVMAEFLTHVGGFLRQAQAQGKSFPQIEAAYRSVAQTLAPKIEASLETIATERAFFEKVLAGKTAPETNAHVEVDMDETTVPLCQAYVKGLGEKSDVIRSFLQHQS